jgi:hypothetical protein
MSRRKEFMEVLHLRGKEDYNNEPVYYCKECLSLKIRTLDVADYCDTCSSTEIGITDIFTWEKMYEQKYGKKFINYEE